MKNLCFVAGKMAQCLGALGAQSGQLVLQHPQNELDVIVQEPLALELGARGS